MNLSEEQERTLRSMVQRSSRLLVIGDDGDGRFGLSTFGMSVSDASWLMDIAKHSLLETHTESGPAEIVDEDGGRRRVA